MNIAKKEVHYQEQMANPNWVKGVSGNPKGIPKGTHNEGRPADWLRAECRKIIAKHDLIGFLAKVAKGDDVEPTVIGDTCQLKPASIKDRTRALEILLDRGYGKAIQAMELIDVNPSEVGYLPTRTIGEAIQLLTTSAVIDAEEGVSEEATN